MKVPLRWLRELVPFEGDTAALCERLTMGGLEVDAVEQRGADLSGVVAARVKSVDSHPDADRLRVCQVDAGDGASLTIVCGAANVRRGMIAALARCGAELPGGTQIGDTVIRGVASAGMLCSLAELGLEDSSDGIVELDRGTALGSDVGDLLGARDTILEISITPNRGDCLSLLGLAREVALLTGTRLKLPRLRLKEGEEATAEAIAVRIDDVDGCRRYAARVVRGVRVGPSPQWMRWRLEDAGVRAINNVVDVTNYVMLERGQPLHAFDLERLPQPQIVVRRAASSRALQTLDGVVRELAADDLLITTGDEPVAVAGVMGGADSEVHEATTDVLLEAACFDPSTVRGTARRMDLHSEASYRFERGVDVDAVVANLDRAASLLAKTAGGTASKGVVDVYPSRREPTPILLRPQRVGEVLGYSVGRGVIRKTMKSLGARVSSAGGGLSVTAPTYRNDLEREIDLIEEVARVVGYAEIPSRLPARPLRVGSMPARMACERQVRRLLCGAGLSELVGLAFASTEANETFPGLNTAGRGVRLLNPIARDEGELRRSILHSVVAMWRYNRNQGAVAIGGFSIGKTYWWNDGRAREGWRLGGVVAGAMPARGLGARRPPELSDVKGILESVFEQRGLWSRMRWQHGAEIASFHPGKSAVIRVDDQVIGMLGCLHPDVEAKVDLAGEHWLFEIDLDLLTSLESPAKRFAGLPRYPAVARDLAVVVDADFASDQIVRYVCAWKPDLVEAVELFDEYVGSPIAPGKKSLAYSVAYRAADRTLTDEEVNGLQEQLLLALEKEFAVEQRQ